MSPTLQLTIVQHRDVDDVDKACEQVVAALKSAEGVQAVFLGSVLDAPSTVIIAVVWKSYESVNAFVKGGNYPQFYTGLKDLAIEPPRTTHCLLSEPKHQLEALLHAPVVELAPLRLKGDKIQQHYINFETAGKMIAAAKGYVAQFQAPQMEDPCDQWSLAGWESIEHHHAFNNASNFPQFLELVAPNVDMPGPPLSFTQASRKYMELCDPNVICTITTELD